MMSLTIENNTLRKDNSEFNHSHLFFFLCSSFPSVPDDMVADKKEVIQGNKTMKKEMDKMKKDADKVGKRIDAMEKRFQKRMDEMESQVIFYSGFPRPNSDSTLTSTRKKSRNSRKKSRNSRKKSRNCTGK